MLPMSLLSPSGIPTVDARWGGLAAGSAYLLIGRAGAGRSALALQSAGATVDGGGRALLLSPRAPDVLLDIGTAAGVDLRAVHATGRFRVLRIPAAADLASRGSDGLDAAYRDLAGLVASERPDRVVVEDLTPLVQFDSFERFRDAFAGLVGALRAAGVTLVVGLGEPANAASEHLIGVVRDLVDGTVSLDGETRQIVLAHRSDAPTPDPVSAATPPEAPPAHAAETPRPEPTPGDPHVAGQSSDGASVEVLPPAAPVHEPPPVERRDGAMAAGSTAARRASDLTDGLPRTRIVPPPDPDPSLLEPVGDLFGLDPATSMFEQGYLVDSGAGGLLGFIPAAGPGPAAFSPPSVSSSAPTFASLGAPAPPRPADPAAEVRHALDAAFAARAQGTPFLVVAARMEPDVPESAHFFAVADGLRSALGPADRLLVDLPRRRAVVVLPGVGADGAGALFAGLQAHLRRALGPEAEAVLRAVAAVSIPEGQPFTSSADLLQYAYES